MLAKEGETKMSIELAPGVKMNLSVFLPVHL